MGSLRGSGLLNSSKTRPYSDFGCDHTVAATANSKPDGEMDTSFPLRRSRAAVVAATARNTAKVSRGPSRRYFNRGARSTTSTGESDPMITKMNVETEAAANMKKEPPPTRRPPKSTPREPEARRTDRGRNGEATTCTLGGQARSVERLRRAGSLHGEKIRRYPNHRPRKRWKRQAGDLQDVAPEGLSRAGNRWRATTQAGTCAHKDRSPAAGPMWRRRLRRRRKLRWG